VNLALPAHKTKIVATIGPASESLEMLTRLIRAGLNVARLNFSHGDFSKHAEVIRRIRDAAVATGKRVANNGWRQGQHCRGMKITGDS
jgi:pyruvate kinase